MEAKSKGFVKVALRPVALLLGVVLMGACGKPKKSTGNFTTLDDFCGHRIASYRGAVYESVANRVIGEVEHVLYDSFDAQVQAILNSEVAGMVTDQPVGRLLAARHGELTVFPTVMEPDRYGFGLAKGSPLVEKVNAVLEQLAADGTATAMTERWFSANDADKQLPALKQPGFDGSAGVLRFGYDPVLEPMLYTGENGAPTGYDIELIMRVAQALNMELQLVPVVLGQRENALASGTVDIVGSCMSITEERLERIDFTLPYYTGGVVMVVRADRVA